MAGFLDSVLTGNNPTLTSTIGKAGSISDFGTNTGEGAITDANKYYQNILSNDPSKIAESIAPEIQAGQQQTQQEKGQLAQFGTRSGGATAASAGADAANRSNIISLIAKLKGQAASGETGIGENQSQLGLSANSEQAQMSQEQWENMINSILGKGAGQAVGAGVTTGLSSIGL